MIFKTNSSFLRPPPSSPCSPGHIRLISYQLSPPRNHQITEKLSSDNLSKPFLSLFHCCRTSLYGWRRIWKWPSSELSTLTPVITLMCLSVGPEQHFWQFSEIKQLSDWFWCWRRLTVSPVKPGSPQSTSLVLTEFTSSFLLVAISSKYLFQSWKLSFAAFLHPEKEDFLLCKKEVKCLLGDFLECNASVCGGEPPLGWDDSRLLEPLVGLAELDRLPVRRLVSELGEEGELGPQHCDICNDLHQHKSS